MYVENIVIGKPIVDPKEYLSYNEEDWDNNEKEKTIFTNERFLPKLMAEIGIVKSVGEVRRNQPKLMIMLDKIDFVVVKWGKRTIWIVVGE